MSRSDAATSRRRSALPSPALKSNGLKTGAGEKRPLETLQYEARVAVEAECGHWVKLKGEIGRDFPEISRDRPRSAELLPMSREITRGRTTGRGLSAHRVHPQMGERLD